MPVRRPLGHAAVAVVPLALVIGCGSTVEPAAEATAAVSAKSGKHRIESIKADCMKREGFQYIPFVPPPFEKSEEMRGQDRGDLPAMRRFREKYGYGIFAMYVYPTEFGNPQVKPENPPPVNPNFKIQGQLSETQREAYRKAGDTCYAQAVRQVTGKKVTSVFDRFNQVNVLVERLTVRELNGDSTLAELAAGMADCLKAKGYAISSTTPFAMGRRGPERFRAEENALGDPIPEEVQRKMDGKAPEGARYAPNLTPEQARPYLDREIKDALDDLECGRRFHPVYQPAKAEIEQRAYREFGLEE